jgi:hypothetical protein
MASTAIASLWPSISSLAEANFPLVASIFIIQELRTGISVQQILTV